MSKDPTGAADGPAVDWLNQGNRHFEHKQLSKARRAYETASRLARAAGDRPTLAMALNNLGAALNAQGQHEQARRCYEEALPLEKELAQAGSLEYQWMAVGTTQHNLADICYREGRLDEARQRIDEALAIRVQLFQRHQLQFLPDTVASVALRACIDEAQGRLEDALAHFERAVQGRRTLSALDPAQHVAALAATLDKLSGVCSKLGREDEARRHAQEAESMRTRLAGSPPVTLH